jgi:tetratricopeptide (TPR) repeat protein
MWAYVRYTERQSLVRYLLVVVAFVCGLMSKPMVVTLPFVLLLLDVWPLRRVGKTRPSRLILEKVPLLLLAAGSSIVTYLVQQRAGAVSSLDYVPLAIRIQNALITYVRYLGQFLWPADLAVVYPYTEPELWRAIAAGLLLAGVTALAIQQWSRRPYFLVGWFWYLGTLVPVIGLVQVGVQSRADRYTYLPMVGIAIMLAWGGAELAGRRGGARVAVVGLAGVAAAGWLAVTWQQIGYWQDSIALFRRAVGVTEGNYIAHGNLGASLRNSGQVAEAVEHFEVAQKLHPTDSRVEENLGEALLALDRISEAIPHLQQSIRLQPTSSKAYVDLGSAFAKTGRMEEAAAAYREALRLAPMEPGAHYGLGTVLLARGLREEARLHLEKALPQLIGTVSQQPDQPDHHFNLGGLYDALGRNEEAIVQFSETVRLRPQDTEAWFKLGALLTNAGRYDEAIRAFSEAIRLKPDFADAQRGLDYATRAQQSRK